MKIYEILNEAVSSVLYHATNFHSTVTILREDRLKARDGVSFTRSLTGEYHIGNKMIGVIFEFDGNLLNQKYKGGPVGTEDWDWDDVISYRGKENKQQEDRLDIKGELPNITKYIKNATIFCPKEFVDAAYKDDFDEPYESSVAHIPAVVELLSKRKIPVRYAATVKEIYNRKVNNKQGFLEVVATVDEDIARKMGLTITKKYEVELSLTYLNDDEELEHLDSDKIVIAATSDKDALQKANAEAEQRTKDNHARFGEGSGEWYVDDVDEMYDQ